ncbi:hypothetical protein HanXRQr2_Chr02g0069711 [Helianthus annuus]|uniref:Uncharacterized protein n=1 Tax=Helianthus annuus TaxID=4232 RepID=A0A9K3JN64_HELAN|nr:hypothetical protein HanXRQr2_Chr02g0069711 [Helianthus annuus]KAJ0952063.1 hypothetical protein HanPSC8_Chr02g0067731 [Helianthus annuus]
MVEKNTSWRKMKKLRGYTSRKNEISIIVTKPIIKLSIMLGVYVSKHCNSDICCIFSDNSDLHCITCGYFIIF